MNANFARLPKKRCTRCGQLVSHYHYLVILATGAGCVLMTEPASKGNWLGQNGCPALSARDG